MEGVLRQRAGGGGRGDGGYPSRLSATAKKRPRLRSRTRDLAERRLSLVKLLVAIFVARMVVTVVEVTEQRLSFFSILVTAAIAVEAWRAWSVARVAKQEHAEPAPLPDTPWDRFLRPLERVGPAIVYGLTVVFAVVRSSSSSSATPTTPCSTSRSPAARSPPSSSSASSSPPTCQCGIRPGNGTPAKSRVGRRSEAGSSRRESRRQRRREVPDLLRVQRARFV